MEQTPVETIFYLFLVIVFFFAFVAIFRDVGAWIFKINEVLENQEHILKELKSLREKLDEKLDEKVDR